LRTFYPDVVDNLPTFVPQLFFADTALQFPKIVIFVFLLAFQQLHRQLSPAGILIFSFDYIFFFISITGVESSISNPLTVRIFLLISWTSNSETATGFGLTGLRVEKTPRLGFDLSPR
jgi:hypothetical protein